MADREKELDDILSDIIKQRAERGPEPDMDRIWSGIQQKLQHRRRSAIWWKAAVTAVALFIAVNLFVPDVQAVTLKLWRSFKVTFLGDSTGQVHPEYQNPSPSGTTAPPSQQEFAAIEEAQAGVPFPIKEPGYLPEGCKLKSVNVANQGDGRFRISLLYTKGENGYILITEENRLGESHLGLGYDTDDTVVQQTKIWGSPAVLFITQKDSSAKACWDDGVLTYAVSGIGTPEEIVRIAGSLK